MGKLRESFLKAVIISFWCLIILNSAFFLAEINALKNAKNKAMLENVQKMFCSFGIEEEKTSSENSGDSPLKETDFLVDGLHHFHLKHYGLSIEAKSRRLEKEPSPGFLQIIAPPPDFLSGC